MNENGRVLLDVQDLSVEFRTGDGMLEALSGVDFTVREGEVVAVVGESGSGKSVTALGIMGLLGNGRVSGGRIMWDGLTDLATAKPKNFRAIRGNDIAMIFQDPMTSLDPLYTIGNQLCETLRLHRRMSRREARTQAIELLGMVGIPDPDSKVDAYPHEMSGGQRQRVMIAIALACSPRLLIADEPTTALDVTVEAQVLALLRDLQRDKNVSLMLITHDMGVVAEMADRVVVFYAGRVAEQGSVDDILQNPRHPYTQALLQAIPRPTTPRDEPMPAIAGNVPALHEMPSGCRFAARCPLAHDACEEQPPPVAITAEHSAACWLAADDRASVVLEGSPA
ncbi:ABC transporter ATP-binding protein [Ornithinimicrobium faecis]|uniref:ABC transporter ATP-binding protein n=1 Tax=Ornithinimicrobium faecis TaxID=2934158 RepID=A0ABY4YUP5_9MICO|nr:ABC transporter ATP-binding protein [Ornithinimicrobium sp. HY1793]USQ80499.1 ABC transporter ATP-binding protein [Ornithinimicrobium sp. HY1793]